MLVCVPSATPVCGAGCSISNGQTAANQYCTSVGTSLMTGYNTCVDAGGGLRICAMQ
jgi:hypothetical protein